MNGGSLSVMKKQGKMLIKSLLSVHFEKILAVYLVFYLIFSLVIWHFDPDIKNLSDALWFTFQTATTIGYGDLIVNSVIGRFFAVVLSVYSIAIVAIFTGIIAGFYVELMKMKSRESAREFLSDLERLSEMSHEELVELSERAKRFAKQ